MRTALLLVTLMSPALASCGPKDQVSPAGFCSPDPLPPAQAGAAGAAATGSAGCELAAAGK